MYIVIIIIVTIFAEIRAPLEPVVTEVIPAARNVTISWMIISIVHDDETYTVYYDTDNVIFMNSTEFGPASVPDTYTDTITGLIPFTTYYFFVSAENSVGNTSTSVMTFMTEQAGVRVVIEIVHNSITILLFVVHVQLQM